MWTWGHIFGCFFCSKYFYISLKKWKQQTISVLYLRKRQTKVAQLATKAFLRLQRQKLASGHCRWNTSGHCRFHDWYLCYVYPFKHAHTQKLHWSVVVELWRPSFLVATRKFPISENLGDGMICIAGYFVHSRQCVLRCQVTYLRDNFTYWLKSTRLSESTTVK